jgi:hypothetical protein
MFSVSPKASQSHVQLRLGLVAHWEQRSARERVDYGSFPCAARPGDCDDERSVHLPPSPLEVAAHGHIPWQKLHRIRQRNVSTQLVPADRLDGRVWQRRARSPGTTSRQQVWVTGTWLKFSNSRR